MMKGIWYHFTQPLESFKHNVLYLSVIGERIELSPWSLMENFVLLCIAYMSSMYSPMFINVKCEFSSTLNKTGLC